MNFGNEFSHPETVQSNKVMRREGVEMSFEYLLEEGRSSSQEKRREALILAGDEQFLHNRAAG